MEWQLKIYLLEEAAMIANTRKAIEIRKVNMNFQCFNQNVPKARRILARSGRSI